MKRAGAVLALLLAAAGGGVAYVRTRPPDLPPPPTEEQLAALRARRDALQDRLRAVVIASGEKSLEQAPQAGLMIGIPTAFTRSIIDQIVTGVFQELTLTLRNLKVHKEGSVKAKMLIRKKEVGAYVLDVQIHEVQGVLRPGRPEVTFTRNRVALKLPVKLAEGKGNADIRLQWDSKGLAANAVCGDVDVTKPVTGGVIPQDYELAGAFAIAASGEKITLTPDFPELAVRIIVDPSEQAWAAVDEVVKEQRAGCEVALNKVDIRTQLAKIVGRGFNVKIPPKLIKPVRLPAGVSQSLEVQGIRLDLQLKPTGVLVAGDRLWYGADLTVGSAAKPKAPTQP
ncbi:MAG TPA: hypothetical protein VFM88_02655 [Vicinamibacteria bacterium]|nr:hypothetical protein [Vicinamibacteria bacterium]